MNAGEAVYQGREGTGLAQILNWQDARPLNIPFQQMAANRMREQQLRRAKIEQDDKKIDEFTKFGKGYELFNPTHQRDINQFTTQIANEKNSGKPIEQIMRDYKQDADKIKINLERGKAAAELYNKKLTDLKNTENIDMSRAIPFMRRQLFPEPDQNGYRDLDQINEGRAEQVDIHPSNFDADGAVLGSASKIKNQIEIGDVDPEMFRGNNGAYFEKVNNKYRFRVDPATGKIASDVIDFYANQDKIYDRILWDNLAKKQGFLTDGKLMPDEINAVDEMFLKEKNNPQNAPEVKKHIEELLNQIQQTVTRTDVTSAGRDVNPNSYGSGGAQIQSNIQKDPNLFQYNSLEEAEKQGGVASHGDGSVPYNSDKMSNLEGIYPGKKATFVGTKIDAKTGKAVAQFTDDKGYKLQDKELDTDMRARLNNVAKSRGEGINISKVIQETDKVAKSGGKRYVDEPALNQTADEFTSMLFDKDKANDSKEQYAEDLKTFLKDNGITMDVEVDRNYGAQWINGGPFVKIKDQQFDLSKPVDKKKIKSLLYDSNPARFSTDKKAQKPNFDPNNPL